MAKSDPGVARPLVAEAIKSTNSAWHRGAAKANAILNGAGDAQDVVFRLLQKSGFGALSKPQQNYLLSNEFIIQVTDGGFLQFFSNPSGERANETPQALEAVGAALSSALLRKALQLRKSFEKGELWEDAYEKALNELDSQFFESGCDGFDTHLELYAAANAGHFQCEP